MLNDQIRINNAINADPVRLIDQDGKSCGVISNDQAKFLACEYSLDLVEISPGANPPVVKLINYDKYRYELERKNRLQRANSKASDLKEVKISYKIDEHDFDFKSRRAEKFLNKGDKVKLSMRLIGRENIFTDRAHEIMKRFCEKVEGEFESAPNKMGNQIVSIIRKKK